MKHPRLTLLALLLLNSVLSTAHAQPTIEWDRTLGGSGTDFLADFWLTADGGYILGGSSQSNTSGEKSEDGRGDWDVWVMKLNADRTIQWQRTLGGNKYDALCDFYQTVDGGYILGGTSSSNVSGEKTENSRGGSDYWVIKLSATGTIEWQKTLGGSANDALYPVRQTSDGGYILGGESISNSSGEKTQNSRGGYDYWVVKLSATGNIEWDRTLGGSEWD
ncbi:MAG: T9SS C-terminal target domain-containing protein, partial [Sphingobacteriia bacterium]